MRNICVYVKDLKRGLTWKGIFEETKSTLKRKGPPGCDSRKYKQMVALLKKKGFSHALAIDVDVESISFRFQGFGKHQFPHPVDSIVF